ncbi:DUF3320 domain-containing protein [Erythrobacter sp. SCSIO 43205]|uniref:DUF3320 domain-containing protein n=1 Tax=Erythrobacter sp. SCSIO 43205 TaxID=2779361 RepID=UPI0021060BB8|nr:DUF3320 domain-containing protein [Erythrobacter sp. SCSIO 43205]
MTRPLFQESIGELQDRVQRNQHSAAELMLVRSELMHRNTQAARDLRVAIEQRIAVLENESREADEPVAENDCEGSEEFEDGELIADADQPAIIDPALRKLFDDTRKRLVETGTRNRLVHVNRKNARANVLNIVNERSDDVYSHLSSDKKMRFLAIGKDKGDDSEQIRFFDADEDGFDESRYGDNQLEVKLGPDALQKRLLRLAREARTAEEEQGTNILYLAMGFLTWFEDKSSAVQREAPLVLLPVELKRNERTSTYDILARGDDIVTNLPLARRLKDDFGLELPEIEIDDGWLPSKYFDRVEEAISERERWAIDRDGMQLGFFSFAKLLMYLDLDPERWPDGALEKHGLVNGLLHEGFESEEPIFSEDVQLDEALPPQEIFHVVDADSSQAKVIEEVRKGRNLVVQGPPGTGKSQTITNIIATAAREGKTVLFVAEKMAALSVVHDRLVKTGLSDICLELHSKASNKKAVLAELGRTLSAAGATPDMPGPPDKLKEARDRLNHFAEALHRPIGDTGRTPFEALSRQSALIGSGSKPPSLEVSALATMTKEEENDLRASLVKLSELIAVLGEPSGHPLKGIQNLNLQPVELNRFEQKIADSIERVREFDEAFATLTHALGLETPSAFASVDPLLDMVDRLENLPDISPESLALLIEADDRSRLLETLTEGEEWEERKNALQPIFVESAFSTPIAHLRGPIAAGESSFFARLGSSYRSASRELGGLLQEKLPSKATDRLQLLDELLDVQSRYSRWNEDKDYCAEALGEAWRGSRTKFSELSQAARWADHLRAGPIDIPTLKAISAATNIADLRESRERLKQRYSAAQAAVEGALAVVELPPEALGENGLYEMRANRLCDRLGAITDALPFYKDWALYRSLIEKLDEAGLAALSARIESQDLLGADAVTEFDFARAECLWNRAINEEPALVELRDLDRHKLVDDFQNLEKGQFEANVAAIRAQHLDQVPRGAQGEMRVIRGELGKRRAHIALRRLFSSAPTALRRIKPVLLMSPISVAQFLEPGLHDFDLLVIDEASQVRPEDALGAIARARQIVVVGDQKQLPPTSFFDRLLGDAEDGSDDDDETEDDLLGGAATLGELESVLTLCEARGLGSRMLEWHYRSRDPSLIKVSNREFYESGLILPPSPLQDNPDYGLCFTRVDGAYDRGGKRDNRIEGEAIVERICEHARSTPKLSLGVVTFSSAQRNLLTELLELERRRNRGLDEFLREGKSEDFFVKNIENVQGDERDVILISVGYGPVVPRGPLTSMSFGPVNAEGGERRLNVLFTRARLRCEVFASFEPGAMDLSRTSREGPKVLKRFLEYAKAGTFLDAEPTGDDADSPFEEDVAEAIRSFGFLVDGQVGSAGFRIDLGVRDPERPGTYILAVECDGATYHSALWARERDRLRQGVLEHLGWRFHRIWSTDWFYNREAEIRRLQTALEVARDASCSGVEISGSNQITVSPEQSSSPIEIEVPEFETRKMPAYERADVRVTQRHEPHEVHISVIAELVQKIVAAEGPIHQQEVARRVAEAFGKERAGSRILGLTLRALRGARQTSSTLRDSDDFWFTKDQKMNPPIRDRSTESGSVLKAENISLIEIAGAISIAREDNAGGSDDELIRSAAHLLGFKRVGPDLRLRFQKAIAHAR